MDKDPTLESNPIRGDPDSKHRRFVRTKLRFSICTICPRSNDSFYIVSYNIKRVTTSWTHSISTGLIWWPGARIDNPSRDHRWGQSGRVHQEQGGSIQGQVGNLPQICILITQGKTVNMGEAIDK